MLSAPFSSDRVDGRPNGLQAASAAAIPTSKIACLMVLDPVTPPGQTALPDHGARTAQGDVPRSRVSRLRAEHPRPSPPRSGGADHAPGPRPDRTRFPALRRPDPDLPRERRPDRVRLRVLQEQDDP